MNKLIFSLIALIISAIAAGQQAPDREQGFPFIKNFTTSDYKAHAQNFAIVRGSNGLLYFGNFAGVLQYDGAFWRLIPTEKTTKVSALGVDQAGTVYVGARNEIGLLEPDQQGAMVYKSLLNPKDSESSAFFEVHQILAADNKIYFITKRSVFIWGNGTMNRWNPEFDIMAGFYANKTLYLQIKGRGLCKYDGDKSVNPVNRGDIFAGAIEIKAILPYPQNQAIIATGTEAFYLLDQNGVKEYKTPADELFRKSLITSGVVLSNGSYAIGTFRKGVVMMQPDGTIIQKVNKSANLQNENIQALFADNNNNILWAALNNGLAMIPAPSLLTYFNEKSGLNGSVNHIVRLKKTLYVATYQGLFYYEPVSFSFQSIPEILTACWSVIQFDDYLLAATSQGLFKVTGRSARLLKEGFTRAIIHSVKDPSTVYIGEIGGLYRMSFNRGSWDFTKISEAEMDVTDLVEDARGVVWGTTLSGGIFKYHPGDLKPQLIDNTSGLPETAGSTVNLIGKSVSISTRKGVFLYNETTAQFEKKILVKTDSSAEEHWYSFIVENSAGDLWVNSGDETNLRLLKKNGLNYETFQSPFLPVSNYAIWAIYPETNGISWFGGPDGLIRYIPSATVRKNEPYPTLVRKILFNNDSVLFSGSLESNTTLSEQISSVFPYTQNSLRFEYCAPFYSPLGENQYQYFLEGFDETWSDWTLQTHKEYTNLPKGNYVFHVKGKNLFGKTAPEATFGFRILAPWYTTIWAYFIYTIIAAAIVTLIVVLRNRKLVLEKRLLEQRIAERTAEVVQQKEEIEKQSQELTQKNDELEKINNTVKSINSEMIFGNLLQTLLEKIKIIKSVEKSTALVYDKELNTFRITASFGWDVSQFENVRISLGQAEKRYLKNATEVYEDIFLKNDFPFWDEVPELNEMEMPKTMLVLVIRVDNKVEAFLLLENMSHEKAFDSKDLSFIKNSKEHIISAFIRTRILEDLQNTLQNLKAMQEQLIQSEKLASLGQLTAGIAHEIQNPLNFVNNFSALSAELAGEINDIINELGDAVDADKRADIEELIGMIKGNLTKIHSHGKRAESIVKGMLQHSRGRTGEFEQVEINNMVSEYVNLAYHGMRAKDKSFNTSIKTNLDPAVGKASIIPQDLSRVILNIVNNSCYALDEKVKKQIPGFSPEVVISTKKIADKIEIRIKDNGTGIPPQVLEKIFNPFFTTKPTGKGTGLGLSMSFDIVNQVHKGKLEVFSQEGESTEFVITIPEKQPAAGPS